MKTSRVSINKVVNQRNSPQLVSRALGRMALALLAAGAFAAAGHAQASQADERNANEHWVGTWGNALHQPDLGVPGLSNTGFNNQTLRQIVHISVGGPWVRVRLSTFGAGSLVIGAAHIARGATASIIPGSDRTLTFGGYSSVTIPPGAVVVSDPVELNAPDRSDLAVSVFVPGLTGPATWHFEGRQTSFISPAGDFTASAVMPPGTVTTFARFWLAGVGVVASKQTGAIVALGESIVDGSQSTVDANTRWTDQLAKRLLSQPGNRAMGVLNEGLAGNRLLHDFLGPNALARFDRDVLAQTGVTHILVQHGANDIFTLNPAEEVTVEQIIQGHRQLIQRAHTKGLKIFGCTLTPVEGFLLPGTPFPVFTLAKEAKRNAVNEWIRTSGEYDSVIDFDLVLRDPISPTKIRALYDSGDHGHPNDLGYAAMANVIELKLFRNGESQ